MRKRDERFSGSAIARDKDEALKRGGNSSAKAEGVGEHKRLRDYWWEDCRAKAALRNSKSDGKSGPGKRAQGKGPADPTTRKSPC